MAAKPSATTRVLFEKTLGKLCDHCTDKLDGEFSLTSHHCGVGEHVSIMCNIDREEALGWPSDLAIPPVGFDGLEISVKSLLPAPAPDIDVRGHVNIVGKSRLQLAEAVGRSIGALRVARGLNRMDVEVIR